MKRITLLFGLSLLACGEGAGPEVAEPSMAQLRGRAFGLEPLANERVQIVRIEGEGVASIVAEARTNAQGEFEVELPAVAPMLRVDVGVAVDVPSVNTIVLDLQLGEERAVELNPFTRLAATRAMHAIQKGKRSASSALAESAGLIDDHFGQIAHARVQPVAAFSPSLATDAERGGLLMIGLRTQAQEFGVSLPALLDGYNRDLAADGVFDGVGSSGPITLGSVTLGGNSLRAEYANVLERVLSAAAINPTAQSSLLERIRRNQSVLFPRTVVAEPPDEEPNQDTTGPALTLALLDANDEPLGPGAPVRGVVTIRAEAQDPSGLRAQQIEIVTADGRFEIVRGLELDTTTLPEGMFRLAFEAVDNQGNLSRVEVSYLADNRAPQISLLHAAVVGTSPAMIRVESADEDRVERITVLANGVLAASLPSPSANSSVSVAIVCPGTTTLEAAAYDRAGNLAVSESSIVCEDRGPEITVRAASWRQEGNVVARYRIDGRTIDYDTAQPIFSSFDDVMIEELVIERYWPRLHEAAVGRDDLPRLRFEVADRVGGGLVIDVRHETAAGPGVWFEPESAGDATFEVPIGYEALGAALLEQHASSQAIVIRAVDAFGITTERAVRFRLALRSPPLWVGSCSLMASALDPATVVNQLRASAKTELGSFAVRYSADVPAGSPIAAPEVEVTANSSGALVELTGLGTVRFDGPLTNRSASGGPSYLSCSWVPVGVGSPYESYRCQGVGFDGAWAWLQAPSTGAFRTTTLPPAEDVQTLAAPLNQASPNPTELEVFLGATPIASGSGSNLMLPSDQDLEAYVSMRPSPIRIQNQVWNWPSQPSLALPGLVPAMSLGTSYWLPTTSGEIGVQGRNLACTPNQRLGGGLGTPNVNPACTWQERALQTVPRLRRLVVRAPRPTLTATLPSLGLPVPVQVSPECGAEWRYELDLGMF